MSAGSDKLQRAVREGGASYVDAAVFTSPVNGTTKTLEIDSGGITIDITSPNRRMLDLSGPALQSVYDFISVPGGEIAVTRTMTYLDNTTETLPLGVFCVTEQSMGYTADGELSLTCPDRWWRIQSNGFGAARSSVRTNAGWQEIKRLVEGAWPNAAFPFRGWANIPGVNNPDQSATTPVGTLIWGDGDRNGAIQALLKLNSLQCYFDANGLAVLQPIPVLTQSSVPIWAIYPGRTGTLEDGQRVRDTSVSHNVIVVSTTAPDVILPIQEVANTRPYPADQLSSLGPLGRVTLEVQDNFRSTAQMIAAGKTQLSKELSAQQQLSLTVYPNPALDGYDVVSAILPPGDAGTTTPAEQHLLERVIIPFAAQDAQQLNCRATRPTGDDSA